MAKTLSNPTVEVDDDVISILPNSLEYNEGEGDANVRSESAGGNSVEIVVSDNAETKLSMCKFKVSATDVHLSQRKQWLAARTNGGVTISLSEDTITVPFRNMILITSPNVAVGADGEIEFEFTGPPVE